jgi:hypothetical protein
MIAFTLTLTALHGYLVIIVDDANPDGAQPIALWQLGFVCVYGGDKIVSSSLQYPSIDNLFDAQSISKLKLGCAPIFSPFYTYVTKVSCRILYIANVNGLSFVTGDFVIIHGRRVLRSYTWSSIQLPISNRELYSLP